MENLNWDAKIAELLNTKAGRYLRQRPFVTLVLLVFAVVASVPTGLFLAFAAVTFIAVAVYCVIAEFFLLAVGGVILLCVLTCLSVVAVWIASVLTIVYVVISNVLHYSTDSRVTEQTHSEEDIKEKD